MEVSSRHCRAVAYMNSTRPGTISSQNTSVKERGECGVLPLAEELLAWEQEKSAFFSGICNTWNNQLHSQE